MILAALGAVASLSNYDPIPGADRLWARPQTRYLMVGENHGTNEAPAMFADVVWAASAKRKVVVALEHPPEQQPDIDDFVESNGDAAARAAFLKSSIWTQPFKDGRNSIAMLDLYDRLREWKQAGRIEAVIAFQDFDPAFLPDDPNESVNRGMARILERTAKAYPGALIVGFGGSVHMARADVMGTKVRSAAGRLPQSELVSVFVESGGGSAWQCAGSTPAHCGPRDTSAFGPDHPRGVRRSSNYILPGFDFIISTGRPSTASPPAVPGPSTRRISPPN